MAYEKQNFVDWEYDESGNVLKQGTVLGKAHLDHMEDGIVKAISCETQELTGDQKAQARENIGAASHETVVESLGEYTEAWKRIDAGRVSGWQWNTVVKDLYKHVYSEYYLIPCVEGDKFLVSSAEFGNAPCAVFFSGEPSSATYLSYYGETGTKKTYTNELIVVPDGCKYVGFNAILSGDQFAVLKKGKGWRGGTLSQKANAAAKKCIEVTYSGSELTMMGQDVGISFGITSVNKTFAITTIHKKSGDSTIGTDMVSPYIIEVDDGVEGVSSFHTGGHHGTDNGSGNPTARCASYAVCINGEPVEMAKKELCDYVTIDVVNYIEAGNTFVDGSGREAIKETIHYKFDGSKLYVTTEIEALEDLRILYYHFIQSTAYNASARYIGDAAKIISHDFSEGGGADMWVDYAILTDANGEVMKMHVEKTGLAVLETAAHPYTSGGRFYWSTAKCGWNIVNASGESRFTMAANEKTMCTGFFDWCPSSVISS